MAKGWYRMDKLLLELGQFNKAEQVYSTVLQQTTDANERADTYSQLGQIKNNRDDYTKTISFYEKALDIDQTKSLSRSSLIG
jgi:tetratricopeptide (TPR) repeat protein